MQLIETTLDSLLSPIVQSLDCELWAVEYQPRQQLLRLYIDRTEGVGLEDCERVSRQVSSCLDVENPIESAYRLEVSSPGLDRRLFTLAHCHRFVGHQVHIRRKRVVDSQRTLTGLLLGVSDGTLLVRETSGEVQLAFADLASVRLVPEEPGQAGGVQ